MKPSIRKELREMDKELDDIKMTMAKLQNLEINKMLNRELQIHCRTVEEEPAKKEPTELCPVGDLTYLYFWTVQGHWFGPGM